MLKELFLENFRCFRSYSVEFDEFNVIVGKNNSGKSTIVDALRLISNIQRYGAFRKDLVLEPRDLPFSTANIWYNYTDDDAVIRARFSSGNEIRAVFPKNEEFHIEYYVKGKSVGSKQIIRKEFTQTLAIVPPVGAFEESESLVTDDYLRRVMISHLTPRHFRNVWATFQDGFDEFRDLLERTWPGCEITLPEVDVWNDRVVMFFKENRITREVFWAGHGLQVWLQLLTHLVKLGKKQTLVLDEPDIYLHSDMQKKLVGICRDRSSQVIIATHAVDIIDEVEPSDVLSIDSRLAKAVRLANVDELQRCILELGSVENLRLAHLLRGNTCLFVEGDDFKVILKLSKTLGLPQVSERNFSVIPLDGSSNWERLKHINWLFTNAFGERIKCYVILDRDYQSDDEVSDVISVLRQQNVSTHIWMKKELENYLINPRALYRMFAAKHKERHGENAATPSELQFISLLTRITDELKSDVQSQMVGHRIKDPARKGEDPSSITKQVIQDLEAKWDNLDYRFSVVSGKDFFTRLNRTLTGDHKIAVSVGYAARALRKNEIDSEVDLALREFIELLES